MQEQPEPGTQESEMPEGEQGEQESGSGLEMPEGEQGGQAPGGGQQTPTPTPSGGTNPE